jgi:NTP pyrophosphatase (non-canonical NTP hydrolase)
MNLKEYLLACLGEEASEIGQEVGKCLRFTPNHICPVSHKPNIQKLTEEIADLHAIVALLDSAGVKIDMTSTTFQDRVKDKIERTATSFGWAAELGTLKND